MYGKMQSQFGILARSMTARGVHAEVEIVSCSACRIGNMADRETDISEISRSTIPADDTVTVDFRADADAEFEDADEVFRYGDTAVYRFECEAGTTPACPCEFVECRGCPVQSFRTTDGAVVLLFVARDVDHLRGIVLDLREQFPDVSLRRLTRSRDPDAGDDLVLLDRESLTARQREVLTTAHRMGYFSHPKDANATEVAGALDINRSTFAEHLSAAQSKLLDSILEA
ncbi:hypothetical protein SAMN04487947_3593 [Halogeometricum rufum]|uniref:Uncharacterized protein n=2 Tax=Halogeometricum rufum TaxID=553469 RepID=A0A1I6IRD6_9EURY|nr:hypothetical protein SAMN04487947_3593 [Halogeometricum rufum]